jgi:hypothetical protein
MFPMGRFGQVSGEQGVDHHAVQHRYVSLASGLNPIMEWA